jgi:hypothetical protein
LDQYSSIDYPQIVVDVIRAMMDGFGFPSGSDRLNFTRISARGYAEEYNFQADARKQVNLISKKIISRFERKVDNSENQLVISTLISACATLKDSLTFLEDKTALAKQFQVFFEVYCICNLIDCYLKIHGRKRLSIGISYDALRNTPKQQVK